MARFCSACGTQQPPSGVFCADCGERQTAAATASVGVVSAAAPVVAAATGPNGAMPSPTGLLGQDARPPRSADPVDGVGTVAPAEVVDGVTPVPPGSNSRPARGCPYCRWKLVDVSAGAVRTCPSCATTYHSECYEENGGCAVFGCPEWVAGQMTTTVPPGPASATYATPSPVLPASVRPTGVGPLTAASAMLPPMVAVAGSAGLLPATAVRQFCGSCGTRLGAGGGPQSPDRPSSPTPSTVRLRSRAGLNPTSRRFCSPLSSAVTP